MKTAKKSGRLWQITHKNVEENKEGIRSNKKQRTQNRLGGRRI